jgi:hypothetical protein
MQWYQLARGRKPIKLNEAEFIPLAQLETAAP